MVTSLEASEIYRQLKELKSGGSLKFPWGKVNVLFCEVLKTGDTYHFDVYRGTVKVWQKEVRDDFSDVWDALSNTRDRDFSSVLADLVPSKEPLSKNAQYNYCIEHFNDYGINIRSKNQMLMLLNILEAHDETLEDIGGYTAQCFEWTDIRDRADAAEFYVETNAFWHSWNGYMDSLLDNDNYESVTEVVERFKWELEISNLVMTTDGIVELDIV